ncbi:hypothetical protein ACO7_440003 [Thiomonas arsenitoxydans]|nr:hypothetical protein THICB2_730024 [Thiomonas sp. CB2]CQR28076.1 hypothetical protein THICB6_130085 [Thiomonas arsenitoxydans]CQR35012.1 hypothetical protein ACO7_440003 [Thiomonas arsenitoxydans]CQR35085.1 hypothetical protein ACO3_440003 [Thiomonas arsenitoxydans]
MRFVGAHSHSIPIFRRHLLVFACLGFPLDSHTLPTGLCFHSYSVLRFLSRSYRATLDIAPLTGYIHPYVQS